MIISLTTASSGPLTWFSDIFALACSTKSIVTPGPLQSSVRRGSPLTFNLLLHFSCFVLISIHFFTVSLQFLLPFFSVFRELSTNTQIRERLAFYFPPPWHHTAFHQMISSGFPCLFFFFEYPSFDHFCASCTRFFTYSHIPRRVFHCFVSIDVRGVRHLP